MGSACPVRFGHICCSKKKILPWLTLFEKLGSSFIFFRVIQARRPINKSTYKKKGKSWKSFGVCSVRLREHVLEFSVSSLLLWPLSCVIFGGMNLPLPLEMIWFTWRRVCVEKAAALQPPRAKDYLGAFSPIKTSSKAKLLGPRGKIIH